MTQQPDANGPSRDDVPAGDPGRRHRHAGPGQPARRGPDGDQLRRRQHLLQGRGHPPGHRRAGHPAVREGLRRRPGHAALRWPGRAGAGPAPRAGRPLPGPGARGRDGRAVRMVRLRARRGGAVDRHAHARAGRPAPHRPPAPRQRDRPGGQRRRRAPDRRVLRRPGRLDPLGPAGLGAGPAAPPAAGGEPPARGGRPWRSRADLLGGLQRRVRAAGLQAHRRGGHLHRPHRAAGAAGPGPGRPGAAR